MDECCNVSPTIDSGPLMVPAQRCETCDEWAVANESLNVGVCVGTAEQVARYIGVKPSTVQNGATPSIRKRMDGMHNRRARYYHVPDYEEDLDE